MTAWARKGTGKTLWWVWQIHEGEKFKKAQCVLQLLLIPCCCCTSWLCPGRPPVAGIMWIKESSPALPAQPLAETLCKHEITRTEPFQCQRYCLNILYLCGLKGAFPGCPIFPSRAALSCVSTWHTGKGIPPAAQLAGALCISSQQQIPQCWLCPSPDPRADKFIPSLPSPFITFFHTNCDMVTDTNHAERRKVVKEMWWQKTSCRQLFPVDKTHPCSTDLLCSAQDLHPQDQQHNGAIPGTPKAPAEIQVCDRPWGNQNQLTEVCWCWDPALWKCSADFHAEKVSNGCRNVPWPPSLDIYSLLGTHQPQTKMLGFYTLKRA